jgi:hypothetical protein
MPLSESQAAAVALFDSTTRDALLSDLGVSDTATSGTVSLTTANTDLSVTGTVAFTLPDGTVAGQRKRVTCAVAATTPIGTLTVTSPSAVAGMVCPATFVFNTVGQWVEFVWTGTVWRVVRTQRAGVTIPVIGTTVLTGFHLNHTYSCSVTGTVVSATTRSLPNGTYPGDFCIVACSTAASIPVGSIAGTYVTLANAAATDLQAIGATTDTATLSWNGSAWLIITATGITVA